MMFIFLLILSVSLLQTLKRPLGVEAITYTPYGQYLTIGSQEPQITFIRMSDYKKCLNYLVPE